MKSQQKRLEQTKVIETPPSDWESDVLPLNYVCVYIARMVSEVATELHLLPLPFYMTRKEYNLLDCMQHQMYIIEQECILTHHPPQYLLSNCYKTLSI